MSGSPSLELHTIFDWCRDVEEVRKFYGGVLGAEETYFDDEHGWLTYQLGGTQLAFIRTATPREEPGGSRQTSQPAAEGEHAQSWILRIDPELYSAVTARIQAAGLETRSPEGEEPMVFVLDPMGRTIELWREAAVAEPIRWKVLIPASASAVYDLISTDEGRARFWAESTSQTGGTIEFRFPNGLTSRETILSEEPGKRLMLTYFGSRVTWSISEVETGCEVQVTDEGPHGGAECDTAAGWVSVLLALKAWAVYGVDLRNHDPGRTWSRGYADN